MVLTFVLADRQMEQMSSIIQDVAKRSCRFLMEHCCQGNCKKCEFVKWRTYVLSWPLCLLPPVPEHSSRVKHNA